MEGSSSAAERPSSTAKRIRGRPKKEAVERENLSQMLRSNVSTDVSRRFLQKMKILKKKRKLKLKAFNFDDYLSRYIRTSAVLSATPPTPAREKDDDETRTLAFINECAKITYIPYENSFASRLNGLLQPPLSKTAPPYIRREYWLYPLGLQFLQEIAFVARNKIDALNSTSALVRSASPIDLIPLSSAHISQCNALLERLFWPGINISDCISYRTGIVALYRKLVVGVGVVTPDGYLMYLAVRPYWEGQGLGKMMLWWLVKENDNVDITLHVAADNPGLIMYQSFGFKAEEYIVSFYDKFYDESDRRKRDALFLRLRRG